MKNNLEHLATARRVGLFDSGLGGLSVLRSLAGVTGQEREFIYIGDTLRCPYGDRSPEEIVAFVNQLTAWLELEGADAIVMACNTSAAHAASELEKRSSVPVFDLVTPTAAYLAGSGLRKVGVIATASTASSHAFANSVRRLTDRVEILETGCPLLVPVVEAGLCRGKEAVEALRVYVLDLIAAGVEAIVYGCTHYPFLEEALLEVLRTHADRDIRIINPADILATSLGAEVTFGTPDYGGTRFMTTGDAETFASIASLCLEANIDDVHNLPLPELLAAAESAPATTRARTQSGAYPSPAPVS
ncbi:MAG: glutamate racemase [Candidatus Melainabacteria bacterium]|nr:glutamate racemase [Candidatus Melainabacteria bacterium]